MTEGKPGRPSLGDYPRFWIRLGDLGRAVEFVAWTECKGNRNEAVRLLIREALDHRAER
jgi:hypothetical protein